MRIILACDRSGGHFFPARCLANYFGKERVFFFVPSYYFKFLLRKDGFSVYGFTLKFRNILIESIFRFWESVYLIFKLRPHRVIGFGGRDTFFLILLSRLFFIDVAIYEPNVILGKTNRVLALFVKRVYRGMPPFKFSNKDKWVKVPIRDELMRYDKKYARKILGLDYNIPVIMCFGGSQGSEFINTVFRQMIEILEEDCSIIHITGFKQYSYFLGFYDKIKKKAIVYDFCENIEFLYSAADIVICRGGALSIGEVVSYKIPAIFVPYPGAENHQYVNVSYLKKRDACYMVDQRNFSFKAFKECLEKLLSDSEERLRIKDNLKKIDIIVDCREFSRSFEE